MTADIDAFNHMKGAENQYGVCDRETITLLVSDKIEGQYFWRYYNNE